jgi:tropomyosin, fungi type
VRPTKSTFDSATRAIAGRSNYLDRVLLTVGFRLRETDVKAGHYQRKVQALEQERDQWEQKYEEMATTHKTLKSELEDLQNQISSI